MQKGFFHEQKYKILSEKHFFADFARRLSCTGEEYLTKIGGGTESEHIADLLNRAVGGRQKLNGSVAEKDLALGVGRDAKHMAKGVVDGRFADTAMAGNVYDSHIGVL